MDLTLITNNVVRRIKDWKISDEESNSYHATPTYDIITEINNKNKTKRYKNIR